MKIIGITGRARSGKDTMATMLASVAGRAVQLSFASPIREFIANLTGMSVAQLVNSEEKEAPLKWLGGKSPRQLMQTLGTEWGRDLIDKDLWIKVARRHVEALAASDAPPTLVVFSDVRFDNEAQMIRDLGGWIIHMERQSAARVSDHVSEAGVTRDYYADVVVYNEGSLARLDETARKLWETHGQ